LKRFETIATASSTHTTTTPPRTTTTTRATIARRLHPSLSHRGVPLGVGVAFSRRVGASAAKFQIGKTSTVFTTLSVIDAQSSFARRENDARVHPGRGRVKTTTRAPADASTTTGDVVAITNKCCQMSNEYTVCPYIKTQIQ
jgi:hypothetical protein